jgi:hypothetical protein
MTEEALQELDNFAVAVRKFAREVANHLPIVKPQADDLEYTAGNVRLALADCKVTK